MPPPPLSAFFVRANILQIVCLYNADWFRFFNSLPAHLLHYLLALMNSHTHTGAHTISFLRKTLAHTHLFAHLLLPFDIWGYLILFCSRPFLTLQAHTHTYGSSKFYCFISNRCVALLLIYIAASLCVCLYALWPLSMVCSNFWLFSLIWDKLKPQLAKF